MSSAMGSKREREDISEAELLAPWHASGKLGEADARLVQMRANSDAEFAQLIEEARRERKAAVAVNEALGKPPQAIWERLEQAIEQDARERPHRSREAFFARLKASLSDYLDAFSMRHWQAAAAVAIAICIAQAAAIAYLTQEIGEPAKYGVASGPNARAVAKAAFIVSFSQTATIADVTKVLEDAGASIIDGPSGEGLYRLGPRSDTVEAKELAYQKLRASPTVKLTLPAK
jgi:hypothetical protein